LLLPKIAELEILDKSNAASLAQFEVQFKAWQPKFDAVTQLDSQIKNVAENTSEFKSNLDKTIQTSNTIQVNFKSNTFRKSKLTTEVESLEKEATKEANLKLVDEQISDWTKALTTLKHHKESINESKIFIKEKQVLIDNTTTELNTNTELLRVETKKIEVFETSFNQVSKELKITESTDLNANKNNLVKEEQQWNSFKQYSELYLKLDKSLIQNKIDLEKTVVELEKSTHQIVVLTSQTETQDLLVKDGDKILNLEKSIKNYEADRAKLIPGDECGLCGSTEHPFVNANRVTRISESEQELESRKTKLKSLTQSLNLESQTRVGLETKKTGLLKSKIELESQLLETTEKAKLLGVDCEISNSSKIQIQLNLLKTDRVKLDADIKIQNQLQVKKEELLVNTSTQKEVINSINRHAATLTEKLKNNREVQTITQKSIKEFIQNCKDLEADLIPRLSQFNYILPSIEQTDLFINDIKEGISNYRLKLKELESKKGELVVLETELANDDKQLKEKLKVQEDLQQLIKTNEEVIKTAAEKRQLILPANLSVEDKRLSLQTQKNEIETRLQLNKTVLQNELEFKTKKETLKTQITSDNTKLNQEIERLTKQLNEHLVKSDFNSKQEIENVLLTPTEKEDFTKNKNYITEEGIKIKTLTAELTKDREALNQTKNFTTAEEDITERLEKLSQEQKEHISVLGEIKEAYRKDQEIRDRNKGVYVKIDAQFEIVKVWKQLFHIIGNSKEAFNIYVQRLTLKNLLKLANSHLYQLNKRYSLQMNESYKSGEELNFNLIDHYQTDQSRLVDTSSGGEKFIISLALALGLSDLASKNVKIDSLFIDEGFGTLDNNTLETVISTLETLQSQGKKIGIISHVENLKERIPTQIQVTKKSNGVSSIDVVY